MRMRSAHSVKLESFQDHDEDLHGRHPEEEFHSEPHSDMDFHERQPHNFISRSQSESSISNETDPDGKTKIIMMLQIKLPHHNGRVKVDNDAEANILPLDSFRTMFSHALDK